MLKETPLHAFHVAAGARMVDFAGWEMPIVYRSIIDEHLQTRKSGSWFDVSHMGRLEFTGPGATSFLDRLVTRNIQTQAVGQCRYSLVCDESGGVLDDIIVSRDTDRWIVVCNASNREKLLGHFARVRASGGFDAAIDDRTESTAMVAIQGPAVIAKLSPLLGVDIGAMKRYSFVKHRMFLIEFTIFRSGYTGEDGIEVVLPAGAATLAMTMLAGKADDADSTIRPAGLGARDTLRLEAGMPLYGHELSEALDPLSAGLEWAVDLNKDFIGCAALRTIAQTGSARKLVGLEVEGKRIARQGTIVKHGAEAVGVVTSGTLGPTVGKSIAMAYVDREWTKPDSQLSVDLKGTGNPARVAPLPFYRRQSRL
jgi:aminomethyltransferase